MKTNKLYTDLKNIFLNKTFLFSFLMAWMITNGWAYLGLFLGTLLKIRLLIVLSGAYLSLLWLPFTPEKIITVFLAMQIRKYIFHL